MSLCVYAKDEVGQEGSEGLCLYCNHEAPKRIKILASLKLLILTDSTFNHEVLPTSSTFSIDSTTVTTSPTGIYAQLQEKKFSHLSLGL